MAMVTTYCNSLQTAVHPQGEEFPKDLEQSFEGLVYRCQWTTDRAATVNIVIDSTKKTVECKKRSVCNAGSFFSLVQKIYRCLIRTKCSFRLLFVESFKKRDALGSPQNVLSSHLVCSSVTESKSFCASWLAVIPVCHLKLGYNLGLSIKIWRPVNT